MFIMGEGLQARLGVGIQGDFLGGEGRGWWALAKISHVTVT